MKKKVEQKIREVCPELQELSFGCVIKSYCHPDIDVVTDDAIEIDSLVSGKYATHERKHIEIIGRPIHLDHVLRAMQTKETVYGGYFIHANGWIMWEETKDGETKVRQCARFDLEKDFNNQSEELYTFLSEILL